MMKSHDGLLTLSHDETRLSHISETQQIENLHLELLHVCTMLFFVRFQPMYQQFQHPGYYPGGGNMHSAGATVGLNFSLKRFFITYRLGLISMLICFMLFSYASRTALFQCHSSILNWIPYQLLISCFIIPLLFNDSDF